MLINDLQKIVNKSRVTNKSLEYIKIELKEALIMRTLDFLYNSPKYSQLIFCGGTALKIIAKTNRLSEDLDMDYVGKEFDLNNMANDLVLFFQNYGFPDLQYSIRAKDKVLIIKFPVLFKLGLVLNTKNESDLLYLKIEIEKNQYKSFDVTMTPIMADNLFFVIRHYDMPTLFANKIGAILGRKGKIFNNKYDFKGRDFYDLIWFLENKIKPNLKRTKEILKKEQNVKIDNLNDVWRLLEDRIIKIDKKGIREDMKNLIIQGESVNVLVKNYLTIYQTLVKNL